jgi:serine protease Do
MIVKEKPLKTTIISTDQPFEQIKTVWNQDRCGKISKVKRVIFTRYIGVQKDEQNYIDILTHMDQELGTLHVGYLRFDGSLSNGFSQKDIQNMEQVWNEYLKLESQNPNDLSHLYKLNMGYVLRENTLEWTKKLLFKDMMNFYDQNNINKSYSTRRNFAIKFLIWMNIYLKDLFDNNVSINQIPKVIYYGDIKKHEQYFLLFLSKMGCDVLYINPKEDIKELLSQVKDISVLIKQPNTTQTIIKLPKHHELKEENELKTKTYNSIEKQTSVMESISNENNTIKSEVEKSYVELAQLAKSVILINVYNSDKEIVGRGSGVIITKDGFILTNFHVIKEGVLFGILFENNKTEYFTDRLVKYHQEYDLALLKIDKNTDPLMINPHEQLVRGQKIVAIGSPLGLFNTVSDGIISGFRDFGDIELLQITAPISSGSSGGALIDLYGNLVGITTAGFEGQNLNLAVGTNYIKLFAKEIIKKAMQ